MMWNVLSQIGKQCMHRFIGGRAVWPRPPGAIIIGVQKGGTSALYNYLQHHPDILASAVKEVHFFDQDVNFRDKGVDWYGKQFATEVRDDSRLGLEATPSYIYYAHAMERMAEYNPALKLLLCLRDPIERAYSQYGMYYNMAQRDDPLAVLPKQTYDTPRNAWLRALLTSRPFPDFDELVRRELDPYPDCDEATPDFVRRGLYWPQIERCLRLFDEQQLLVIFSQELRKATRQELHRVESFLAIGHYTWDDLQLAPANVTRRQGVPPLLDQTRQRLHDFYSESNERLRQWLDRDLPWS